MEMKRFFKISILVITTTALVSFTMLWWWRSNMPYNEAGRYYDGFVVWHEQGVILYALLPIFSFLVLVTMGYLVWGKSNAST